MGSKALSDAIAGCLGVGAIGWIAATSIAFAADEPGSRDHPLVGRYQGSTIAFYKASDFDEAALLQAPHDYAALLERDATHDRSGAEWLKVEGRLIKIRYEIPAGPSSLEVMRNYDSALKAKGFEIVFTCADRACFKGSLQDPYLLGQQIDGDNLDTSLYFDHARYLLARQGGAEAPIYAAVLTGEDKQRVTAFVAVVESRPMAGDKITVLDAGRMGQAIAQTGRVSLYGILFDYDKDVLRPESKQALNEIAKLLKDKPDLRLEIVGHTDNRGAPDYNMNLSQRRAASVVAALTRDYGIAAERLKPSGAGLSQPVASNDTEEGRAKNRRVELVAR
jgi:outer membrane protein OmpA-like peptidoglycan-associated protein